MAKGPPSQRYGTPSGRFWANVVLIALAHVALIAGLIRWSVAAKASSNPERVVWLGGAGDLPAGESEKQPTVADELSQTKKDEAPDEKPVVTSAKSEIELPSASPRPTATATPAKPTPTPASKPRTTPRPTRNAAHSVAG